LQMNRVGKQRWGNNVPKDVFHFEDILSFYPDARFIVCVRDVRDFLLSYKNKWKTTGGENADRVRRLYHPIITSLLWRATAAQISRLKALVPTENVLILKYENLVHNAEKAVREMCQFLDEEFEPDMLNVDAENSSFEVNEKGIYSASVGRWRSLLPREEIYVAERITGKRLLDFGYFPANLEVSFLRTGRVWATLPYGLWQAFRANRVMRGPLFPYIAKRLSALYSSRFARPRNVSQRIKISA
jgi:sulfotransferase family protein